MVKAIYDMSFEDYLAVPALSSSAIKIINTSISDYIHAEEKTTTALEFGKALHDAVLYGIDSFKNNYVAPFEPHEDMLKTKEDMVNFCLNNEIPYRAGLKKEELKDIILAKEPHAIFLDDAKENHSQGRIILTDSEYKRILKIHDDIYSSPLAETLSGMKKEVSVFWTDANGIDCKARFDAVGDDMFDLKTFDNFMGHGHENLAGKIIAKHAYDIQAVFYYEAYLACHKAGIEGFENNNPSFLMLFCQSKGGYNYIPAILKPMTEFGEINEYWNLAQNGIEIAKELYKKHIIEKRPIPVDWYFKEIADENMPYWHLLRG